jgi:hypothetical protein
LPELAGEIMRLYETKIVRAEFKDGELRDSGDLLIEELRELAIPVVVNDLG